jgi:hypothetical protein
VPAPGVLANDQSDRAARVLLVTQPQHGTVSLQGDGSFGYTAEPGFYGDDRFQYRLVAPDGRSSEATVNVAVTLTTPGGAVLRDAASDPFTVAPTQGQGAVADLELTTSDITDSAFEWQVPTVVLTVPGVLLVGIVLAQGMGALVWLPMIRRFRRGMTLRRVQRPN